MNLPTKSLDIDTSILEIPKDASVGDTDNFSNYDMYINTEAIFPKYGEIIQSTRALCCTIVPKQTKMDTFNHDLNLDSQIYDVMFNNGYKQQLAANMLALAMFDNVDANG